MTYNLSQPVLAETNSEQRRRKRRTARICEIHRALTAMLSPEAEALVTELDRLHNDDLMETEDRVLRITGQVCIQDRAWQLWRQVFELALDGCVVEPGAEQKFLEHNRLEDSISPN